MAIGRCTLFDYEPSASPARPYDGWSVSYGRKLPYNRDGVVTGGLTSKTRRESIKDGVKQAQREREGREKLQLQLWLGFRDGLGSDDLLIFYGIGIVFCNKMMRRRNKNH